MADATHNDSVEIWKPVLGWEGLYEASSEGRIRSLDRVDSMGRPWAGRVRQLQKSVKGGYQLVNLCRDGTCKSYSVHSLVASAFLGACPPGKEICHNDGDGSNNRPANLRYDTRQQNARDRGRHGTQNFARGEINGHSKLTEAQVSALLMRGKYASYPAMAADYGVTTGAIRSILIGENWTHLWRRLRPDVAPRTRHKGG